MYISVDVGGTNMRLAGALELGNPAFVDEPLRRRNVHDFELDLNFMVDAARQLADGAPIEAIGLGTPGSPNEDRTRIAWAKNLASWAGRPLVESLTERLGCPVFYDNDLMAAGLGEAYYGQTKGDRDYISWGTGIGGATIRAGGLGPKVSVLDWETNFAEWEKASGGAELEKIFGKPPEEFTDEEWGRTSEVFEGHLARYVEAHQPQVVVFGGGLAVRHAQMLRDAGRSLGIKTGVTRFGDDSGLMGGFGLIRRGLAS